MSISIIDEVEFDECSLCGKHDCSKCEVVSDISLNKDQISFYLKLYRDGIISLNTYKCKECGILWESFYMPNEKPFCPKCGCEDVEKLLTDIDDFVLTMIGKLRVISPKTTFEILDILTDLFKEKFELSESLEDSLNKIKKQIMTFTIGG